MSRHSMHSLRYWVLIASVLMLGTGQQANAEVIISLGAHGVSALPPQVLVDQAPIEVQGTVTDQGASAYGYANLSTGTLRANSQSSIGGGTTGASSIIGDTFSFSGPSGGTAYLDWTFSGKLIESGNHPYLQQSGGALSFFLIHPDPVLEGVAVSVYQEYHALVNLACYAFVTATSCLEGDTIYLQGSIPIPVWTGTSLPDYSLQAQLSTWANLGDITDFSNSAHLSMRLPDGVTMQSRSGVFLSSDEPSNAIPEPGSLALFGLGLAGLVLLRRSKFM